MSDVTPLRRELVFVVPGRLDQLTGGYLFDRHIVEGLRARGQVVRVIELTGRVADGEWRIAQRPADRAPRH